MDLCPSVSLSLLFFFFIFYLLIFFFKQESKIIPHMLFSQVWAIMVVCNPCYKPSDVSLADLTVINLAVIKFFDI